MEKNWVWHPRASLEYHKGATQFVHASATSLDNPSVILCPCIDCRNLCHQATYTVLDHLVIRGMDEKYKRKSCWRKHGDIRTDKPSEDPRSECGAYDLIRTAFFDGDSQPESHSEDLKDEVGREEEDEFRKKLEDAEHPLYPNFPNYTKISAIMGLYRIKVKSGMSKNYFDQLLRMVHQMLPKENVIPRSTDEMKKFLKVFGFGYDMIHACSNDCILYRNQYAAMESCPRCNMSRWERDKNIRQEKIGIPATVLRCFPIKDRLRIMFRSKRVAEELRWHYNNASSDGTMKNPVDSLTWAKVNDKWPEFAAEPRNLRLGLSTDGMNPFAIQNTKYSIWLVLLVNYNMHPTLCMKAKNIMLTLLILGPTAPSNNIDVYLAPLIEDLQDLWREGIVVYDSFMRENFTLRAILLWSITDYPALGSLAGCKVKGKQACNVCGKGTPYKWLKFCRKHVYLGNRKRLKPDHPYRRRKKWFDNTIETGSASRVQTGVEIFEMFKDFKNQFGKCIEKNGKRKRKAICEDDELLNDEYEEDNANWRWKKMSILFDLPYWKVCAFSVTSIVWRPTNTVEKLGQAVGIKIAWPADKLILDNDLQSLTPSENQTSASSVLFDTITIYDWNSEDVIVAVGHLCSTDPKETVNNIPIGPGAAMVKVLKVVKKYAYL